MTNINSLRDEKTGRFKNTTNTTKYKSVQFNGKRMSEHSRAICIFLNIPEIPKGFIVHHLDENKKNNDINNLALITTTAHNRIHSHEAWNKDIKTPENTIFKQRIAREKSFLKRAEETAKIYYTGKTQEQVAKLQGITRSSVSLRIKKYEQFIAREKN